MIRREDELRVSFEPNATVASTAGDAELRRFVEASLGSPVDELVRRPLPQSSSLACETLGLRAGGRSLELFFKDFGSRRSPRSSGAEREIEVHRRLLSSQELGTPRLIGSLSEDERQWLLLERVRGTRLAKEPRAWLAAATWLAKFQAYAASRDLPREGASFLVLHDVAHLQATAQDAVRAAARVDYEIQRTLVKALEDYEVIIERIADQPRTVVHGSYCPENILVDEDVLPARVSPVDWKHAALGCALYDVASLTAGLEREEAEELLRHFSSAAAERGLAIPTGAEAWQLVSGLRLHRLLLELGQGGAAGHPRATVERIVGAVERTCLELRSNPWAEARSWSAVPAGAARSHPALSAWRALGQEGDRAHVERVVGKFFGRKGRVVYRLGAIGPEGSPLVAKRCRREVAALENRIYTELLSELPLSTPRCHGWLEADGSSWLFLDDVGKMRLNEGNAAHRACALDWLARLHTASVRIARPAQLPDRGVGRHLALLREARGLLHASLGNPVLTDQDREAARAVLATCDLAETNWSRLEATCATMPITYVHGDFRPKNVYLRVDGDQITLLPIDWEYSGWGIPAVDLGSLLLRHGQPADLSSYRAALEPLAPGLSEAELWTWVTVGRVLRSVSSIYWTRNSLNHPYVEEPLACLRLYCDAIEQAFEELGYGPARVADA